MEKNEEKFVVDDPVKAQWVMEKIIDHKHKIAEKEAEAAAMKAPHEKRIKDVDAWLESEKEQEQRGIDWLEMLLREYAQANITGKKKSINLPSGRIGFRAVPKEYSWNGKKVTNSMPELIEFVERSSPEFIQSKKTVDWATFKKTLTLDEKTNCVVTVDGEVIEGMSIKQLDPKFYVETKGDKQ